MRDLDHFKRINDTYGHSSGDQVLKELARICKLCIRDIDLVARFGGDEFVILLPETAADQAVSITERLRQNLTNLIFDTPLTPISITASFEIAEYQKTDSLQSLIERADFSLYQAMEMGRNQVVLSGSGDDRQGLDYTCS
jgi:diguanylate cyclase